MDRLLPYLVKSSSILLLLWLYYRLFLRRQTFFKLNRFYLLGGLLLSVTLPWVSFDLNLSPAGPPDLLSPMILVLDEISVWGGGTRTGFPFLNAWLGIYVSGVLLFSFRPLRAIIQLHRLKRRAYSKRFRGMTFVLLPSSQPAFSFFNTLFIGQTFPREDRHCIFEHEKIHIRQGHSLDLLLAEWICILYWFQPIVWLFRQSMAENHEYIADQKVIRRYPAGSYLELLVRQTLKSTIACMNYFSSTNLKKRMIMMTKKQTRSGYRLISMLPVSTLLLALLYSFTGTPLQQLSAQPQNGNATARTASAMPQQDTARIFETVETMPQFSDGNVVIWISRHVKYPAEAIEQHIEGKAFVEFVIEKDGTVSSPKIIRSVHPLLDQEALRVVGLMPKWLPGKKAGKAVRVRYVLPIHFAIAQPEAKQAGEK